MHTSDAHGGASLSQAPCRPCAARQPFSRPEGRPERLSWAGPRRLAAVLNAS